MYRRILRRNSRQVREKNYEQEAENMDMTVMNKISYGLYVLTARCGNQYNGCIINTLSQVTSSPNRVSVTVNKGNFTEYMIRSSGRFNVSILDETADFSVFTHFGFVSGRWENKTIDLGTHTMFIADVMDGAVMSDNAPMTYAYYHANVKPKPAAKAESKAVGERWVCNICGYIYEGALPADFVCPLCKHGAADFSPIDENGNVIAQKPSAEEKAENSGDAKWVCKVCGYGYEGDLPENFVCPVCGVGTDEFEKLSYSDPTI